MTDLQRSIRLALAGTAHCIMTTHASKALCLDPVQQLTQLSVLRCLENEGAQSHLKHEISAAVLEKLERESVDSDRLCPHLVAHTQNILAIPRCKFPLGGQARRPLGSFIQETTRLSRRRSPSTLTHQERRRRTLHSRHLHSPHTTPAPPDGERLN